MRLLLRNLGLFWIRHFGSPIRDEHTGELMGRALILVWRGRIHVIGFTGSGPLRPSFYSQDRIRYWRQSLGFTRPTEPDYPRNRQD